MVWSAKGLIRACLAIGVVEVGVEVKARESLETANSNRKRVTTNLIGFYEPPCLRLRTRGAFVWYRKRFPVWLPVIPNIPGTKMYGPIAIG